jgi:poly-gamma-glutamate synthesis protein (capsule biosynthesis protein)
MKAGKRGLLLLPLVGVVLATAVLTASYRPGAEAVPVPDLSPYPWFYLREGRPLAVDEATVELIAVGDVMLGRDVAEEAQPLAEAAPWLSSADVTLGNLESAIVENGTPRTAPANEPQPIILQAPVTAVSHLNSAGFDILSLANNHNLDWGPDGLAETADRLQKSGIAPIGIGRDPQSAYQPLMHEINGVRLAFLAFNAVPDAAHSMAGVMRGNEWQPGKWDEGKAVKAITAARENADAVIVSIHWGYEYEPWPDPGQVTSVEALFAAGADLILGHHPHVVQELTIGRQGSPDAAQAFAAYSLGNFVFDQGLQLTDHGLALRAFFDRQGLRAVQALPVWVGPRPRLMTRDEAALLLSRIQPRPPRIGFTCKGDDCQPEETPGFEERGERQAVSGLFWSGAIDLTGDGQPETIRRAGEQVTIYEAGTAVWTSPPAWRVVDAALGDPNDDGRFELLLAIWQTDAGGYERSQPYIIGYRGGEYKLIWGGRPLARPISEVEIGDVDGDGTQELVVIEQDAVAVWRWQGWNFSLVWRSENGRFQDLILIEEDGRLIIKVTQPY